ncbi:MAG: hypothetical protein M3Y59_03100 [Myxococcota bacterium]|nr:hypothetical protein [Myxococcota bacterium]
MRGDLPGGSGWPRAQTLQTPTETLDRATDPEQFAETVQPHLANAISQSLPAQITDAQLKAHPLAIWVETTLGIRWSETDQRWERARPQTVTEAVTRLAEASGQPREQCSRALREFLLVSSTPANQRTGNDADGDRSFFAFKLHQFISGAGHAFATFEGPGKRRVTVEAQQFHPDDQEKRLYAVHFCRTCGQEYHPVRKVRDPGETLFLARSIDDAPPRKDDEEEAVEKDPEEESEVFGFLTGHADLEFSDDEEDYPDNWLELDPTKPPRLKSHYRHFRVREVSVSPTGKLAQGGLKGWFIPGRFRFCLRCGTTHSTAAKDRNRLASLSAEGRSSATTKPWADCGTDSERLDVFNGLLLAPQLDAAFDCGLISVTDEGLVLASALLSSESREILDLVGSPRIRRLTDRHRHYLPWHRDQIFRP